MLWATPNTWYERYPDIKLDFIPSKCLSTLNDPLKGYALVNKFIDQYKYNLRK